MLFLLVQVPSQLVFSGSMVKFLPGFQGPLPFELETGYVGVGESEEVQLFYYFVKSERNPKEDPLLLWLTGGPGCSACFDSKNLEIVDSSSDGGEDEERSEIHVSSSLATHETTSFASSSQYKLTAAAVVEKVEREIAADVGWVWAWVAWVGFGRGGVVPEGMGPLNFKVEEYNGSLPKLVLNPYSWTKVSNVIFVDSPVGTGFSYARTPVASQSSDFKHAQQLHQFLIKWLIDHPEFVTNPVYIAGDSYSGIPGPFLVQQISNGNEEGIEQLINLQGYILGNPITDPSSDGSSAIPYAHGMGLISDELYESLKRTCGGEYLGINPRNAQCMQYVQELTECLSRINSVHILEPLCIADSPKPQVMFGKRRSLYQKLKAFLDPNPSVPQFGCRSFISSPDGDQGTTSKDLVQVPIGPVTRARAKKFKDVLNGLIQELWAQANSWRPIGHDPPGQQRIITLIQVLEGSGQGQ
uniref:Uncharacterized protein n=1 Tax=Fagus sylvatica TaxID=28930 RepID=A0A2N9EN15_FAGSY